MYGSVGVYVQVSICSAQVSVYSAQVLVFFAQVFVISAQVFVFLLRACKVNPSAAAGGED